MKKQNLSLLITGIFAAISYVSAADTNQPRKGDKPPSTEEVFTQMDINQDNQLSVNEVNGPLKKNFSAIDTNGDGFITKSELNDAPRTRGKRGNRPRD